MYGYDKESDLPSSSAKAVLSVSNSALTIGIHFSPASAVELKHLLSLRQSVTGDRQAFIATLIFVISRIIATRSSSTSSGLRLMVMIKDFGLWMPIPCFTLESGSDDIVNDLVARCQDLVRVNQELAQIRKCIRSDVRVDLEYVNSQLGTKSLTERLTC